MPAEILPGSGEYGLVYLLSPREFRKRIGRATLIAIELELEGTDPARAVIRANLRVLKEELAAVREVDLRLDDTIEGIMGLVALGFKTMEEATAILTP